MGVIGLRVEKQIGAAVPCQMIRLGDTRREYQAQGVDATRLRFAPQIFFCPGIAFQQPEYAPIYF